MQIQLLNKLTKLFGLTRTDRSLHSSLSSILVYTSSFVLLLVFSVFVIHDKLDYENELAEHLTAIAKVTAHNSQGALSFNDSQAASDILGALVSYEHIRYAAVLGSDGTPFSIYENKWSQAISPRIIGNSLKINSNFIEVSQPIIWDNEVIGQVYLLSDLEQLTNRQKEFALIVVILFSLAVFLSFTISSRLIKKLISPIYKLAQLATQISKDNNYSLRAEKTDIREMNRLVDCVNNMLTQISIGEEALKSSEQRLSLALLGAGEGLWDFNVESQQIYLDKHSCNIMSFPDDERLLEVEKWHSLIHPGDISRVRRYSSKFLRLTDEVYDIEFRVQCDDHWLWLKLTGKVNNNEDFDQPLRITGTLQDITKEHKAEEQIRLYASVFDNTSDAIIILDSRFTVLAVNQAFSFITQFSAKEMSGKKLPLLFSLQQFDNIKEELLNTGSWRGEFEQQRKDGSLYDLELELNTVKDNDERAFNYIVAVFSDITQRKRNEEELFNKANYDHLTKLANRVLFHNCFDQAISRAKRNNSKLALLFIDLDKFKQVNDTLGHDAGDELLIQSGKRMKSMLRECDLLARLSGDEFTIIIENFDNIKQVEIVACKIQEDFQREFIVNDQIANIGTSIGISIYPDDGITSEELLKQADTAMYHAKSHGRNSYHFFDRTMHNQAERRNVIETELLKALSCRHISVLYQPRFSTTNNKIIGFDSLVNWVHPQLGIIDVEEFMLVAEETGLIKDIGLFVFETVCQQLKFWNRQGYLDLKVSVAVSAKQFQLSDFAIEIGHIVKDVGVDARCVELALSETVVIELPPKTGLMLAVLDKIGFTLAIDNFGCSFSSFNRLRHLPIKQLNIDPELVKRCDSDVDCAAISSAIIAMAHKLNLSVVAKGVESAMQLDFLRAEHCEFIQGDYFLKPSTADKVELYLATDLSQQLKTEITIDV